MPTVPDAAAALARLLREETRRTRAGRRPRPWRDVADEVARAGLGRFRPEALARAAARLPAATHPRAPLPDAARARLEDALRAGFAAEFPGAPWPGAEAALRRLRARAFGG